MPKFTYKAKDRSGKLIEGSLVATDIPEVVQKLTDKDQVPIKILEEDSNNKKESGFEKMFKQKVKLLEILMVFNNLGTMLRAGLPITDALETLAENQKNARLKTILERVEYDVQNGEPLSESLKKFDEVFSKSMIAMIEIGEEGGNLDKTVLTLSEELKKSYELRKKVKGAMTYPIVVITAMLVIGTFLITYILPQITGFLEGMTELPLATRILVGLSDFMQAYIYYIVPVVVVGIISFKQAMKKNLTFRTLVQNMLLKLPKVGRIQKELQIAQFTRSMGTLLHSGVPIIHAIDIIGNNTSNEPYKIAYTDFKVDLASGVALSIAMEKFPDLFPSLAVRMVAVGEKTGETSGMLFNIADFYDAEVKDFLENISSIIEPMLLFVLGGAVLILALGIVTPMMSMMGAINTNG